MAVSANRLELLQIADAVVVGVGEAARIDLVQDRAPPPFVREVRRGVGRGQIEGLGGHGTLLQTR